MDSGGAEALGWGLGCEVGWDVRLGMGSGLPGLGRTQARARTESQLSHRGPCPSSRSFFLDTENSIFAHKFKVPSGLPHFSIISH